MNERIYMSRRAKRKHLSAMQLKDYTKLKISGTQKIHLLPCPSPCYQCDQIKHTARDWSSLTLLHIIVTNVRLGGIALKRIGDDSGLGTSFHCFGAKGTGRFRAVARRDAKALAAFLVALVVLWPKPVGRLRTRRGKWGGEIFASVLPTFFAAGSKAVGCLRAVTSRKGRLLAAISTALHAAVLVAMLGSIGCLGTLSHGRLPGLGVVAILVPTSVPTANCGLWNLWPGSCRCGNATFAPSRICVRRLAWEAGIGWTLCSTVTHVVRLLTMTVGAGTMVGAVLKIADDPCDVNHRLDHGLVHARRLAAKLSSLASDHLRKLLVLRKGMAGHTLGAFNDFGKVYTLDLRVRFMSLAINRNVLVYSLVTDALRCELDRGF